MSDKVISVGIKGDSTSAVRAMDEAKTSADDLNTSADQLGQELDQLRESAAAKTAAIKAGLQTEQSEIELQRAHLDAARAEATARQQAAKAQGDEAQAMRAGNSLRQVESEQLALVARAKRAEATAVDQAVAARRAELGAIGPLTAAHTQELTAAENHAKALRVEAAAADQAAQRARDLSSAHHSGVAATEQLSGRVQGLTGLLGQMAAALVAAFSFREMVTAAAQMEQLHSGLKAVTQDAAKASQELEFVRVVANRIGADVTEVGKAFLGLSAATKGTAVEGEPTRKVFESVATAMGKAGKSSAETSLALQALAQMASKGTVQMEELRGQLGESLPGALNAAAIGMGITTADLIKLVESGQVAAEDLFPALTKGLNELYGAAPSAQTLSQEITNIKNAFTEMAANIGNAGGLTALKTGAELTQTAITFLDVSLVTIGKTIGTLVAAMATLDFSGLKQSFADIEAESRDKLLKAAANNQVLANAIAANGNEALKTALAQQQSAQATATAGQVAGEASASYAAMAVAYTKVNEEVAAGLALAEREVAAVKARGDARVAEAKLQGDESVLRAAIAQAAKDEADAMAKLAQQRQLEVDIMRAELANKTALLTKQGTISEQRKKELKELADAIALKQVEADKTRAQAASSDALARAKSMEVQNAIAATQAAQAASTTRVSEAKSNLSLLETQRSLAGQSEQLLRLAGDERGARQARISQLEIEIKITRAKAEVQRAEAEGAIAVANATLAELRAKGSVSAVQEAQIQASIRSAQAKIAEANAIAQSTRVTEQQISNLRRYGSEAGAQIGGSMNDAAGSVEGVGDAARATAGEFRAMGDAAQAAGAKADKYGRPGGRTADDLYSRPEGGSVTGANSPTRKSYGMQYDSEIEARLAAAEHNSVWIAEATTQGLVDAKAIQQARQQLIEAREEAKKYGLTYNPRTGKFTRASSVGDEADSTDSKSKASDAAAKESKSSNTKASGAKVYQTVVQLSGRPPVSLGKFDSAADQLAAEKLLRELNQNAQAASK